MLCFLYRLPCKGKIKIKTPVANYRNEYIMLNCTFDCILKIVPPSVEGGMRGCNFGFVFDCTKTKSMVSLQRGFDSLFPSPLERSFYHPAFPLSAGLLSISVYRSRLRRDCENTTCFLEGNFCCIADFVSRILQMLRNTDLQGQVSQLRQQLLNI